MLGLAHLLLKDDSVATQYAVSLIRSGVAVITAVGALCSAINAFACTVTAALDVED